MKKDMMVYLDDIIASMNHIGEYIKEITFRDFENSIEKQDSILRRFEIIGEASSRLTIEFKTKYPDIPWKQMIGLRNIIIHDYSSVNLTEVWTIITKHLPKTLIQLDKLKKQLMKEWEKLRK
jgi:uncharacterized protein with HEPN domain